MDRSYLYLKHICKDLMYGKTYLSSEFIEVSWTSHSEHGTDGFLNLFMQQTIKYLGGSD